MLRLLYPLSSRHPQAFGHLLRGIDFYLSPVREVAILGPEPDALLQTVRSQFRHHIVLAGGGGNVPLLEGC